MWRGCVFAGLCTLAVPTFADTVLGIYAGAAKWQQEASGDVVSGITNVSIENDLGMDDDSNNMFYFALEHPVPAFPNIRLQHADITLSGDNVLSRTIEFNGSTFSVSDAVATDIDLAQTDAVFYYELLDNYVTVDLGLAVRHVDGHVSVASTAASARADFSEVVPMAYAQARVDLPLTGFWVAAQAQGISYSGNQVLDANAQLGWESPVGLGVEVGYRTFNLELEEFDDVETAELDIEGVYFGLNYHF